MRIKKYLNFNNTHRILTDRIEDTFDVINFSNANINNPDYYFFGDFVNLIDINVDRGIVLKGRVKDGELSQLLFQYTGEHFLISVVNDIDNTFPNLIISNRGLVNLVLTPTEMALGADYIKLSHFSDENCILLKNSQKYLNEISLKNNAKKFFFVNANENSIDFVEAPRLLRNTQSVNYNTGGLYNFILQYKDFLVDANYFTINLSLKKYTENSFEFNILSKKFLIKGTKQQVTVSSYSLANNYEKTFSPTDVNVQQNTITINNHGFNTNDEVILFSSEELPDGINKYQVYRVQKIDNNTIKLKFVDNTITINSQGSGTHTIAKYKRNLQLNISNALSSWLGCYLLVNKVGSLFEGIYKIIQVQTGSITVEANYFTSPETSGVTYFILSTLSFSDPNYAIKISQDNKLSFQDVVIENTNYSANNCLILDNCDADIHGDVGFAGGVSCLYIIQSRVNGSKLYITDAHSIGVLVTRSVNFKTVSINVFNKNVGVLLDNGAVLESNLYIFNGAFGVQINNNATLSIVQSKISNAGLVNIYNVLGFARIYNTTLENSSISLFCDSLARAYLMGTQINNNLIGIACNKASSASLGRYITFNNNTVNTTPEINQVGNLNSIICQD